MARLIILIGILLVILGLVWNYFPKAITWFGNLPGDIKIQNENSRVFIPFTSMIVVSIGLSISLSIVLNLASWVMRLFR